MTHDHVTLKRPLPPLSNIKRWSSWRETGERGWPLAAVFFSLATDFLGDVPKTDSQLTHPQWPGFFVPLRSPWPSSAAGIVSRSWKVKLNWFSGEIQWQHQWWTHTHKRSLLKGNHSCIWPGFVWKQKTHWGPCCVWDWGWGGPWRCSYCFYRRFLSRLVSL